MSKLDTARLFSLGSPLAAALAATSALAQDCGNPRSPNAVRLQVEAVGIRAPKGEVAFTVYANDRKKFLAKGGKLVRSRVPATAPVTRSCFWLPPGKYEVALYHDENADHDFNRTLFMPKEGFGFSNDPSTSLGRPSMDDTAFVLPAGGKVVRMKLRYP